MYTMYLHIIDYEGHTLNTSLIIMYQGTSYVRFFFLLHHYTVSFDIKNKLI